LNKQAQVIETPCATHDNKQGVSAEEQQEKGKQLLKAVQNYELDTVVLLLKEGANINWKDQVNGL